jgi:ABC-type multidrug transport system ATPase subunit
MNHNGYEGMTITIFDGEKTPKNIDLMDFGKNEITIGRAADNDIVLDSQLVSKHHAKFVIVGDVCNIYDLDSTNGLFVESYRVKAAKLLPGNMIRIMSDVSFSQNVSILFGSEGKSTLWKSIVITNMNTITIGRDHGCSICLNNSSISKVHVIIRKEKDGYHLYDNKSTNGVIVNGSKVKKSCLLREKDVILLVNTKLIFSANLISYIVYENGIKLEAKDIVKTVHTAKGKLNIVNHISLNIEPGEFVAIIGGSGAGKSSFMNCISGYSKPTQGQVLINGADLYENYETMKHMIGYVPQSDIVYDNLTVQAMLEYAAKLRMPKDTSAKERRKTIAEVISMVELDGREKFMIKSLSGGQRKRVSIAVELLSDPNLFFLDEPSSGLDPGTEEKLMETLSRMSKMGKTIILITHNTMNIHLCDKIIFLGKGGNLCYYGPPSRAKSFFNVENMVSVYNMITDDSELWKRKFCEYSGQSLSEQESGGGLKNTNPKVMRKGSIGRQTAILTQRHFALIFHDVKRLLMLLLQAPLLGFLIYLVADDNVFSQYEITKAILFAMSCCAFWIGILNSIQEVCKERTILKREYLSGLSMTAYILSKFVVLGIVCLIQSALLLGTFALLVGLPEEGIFMSAGAEFFITTFLTAFSATAMGLFVSSLFSNADRAMTVAPILLMPQILFSGLAFSLSGIIEKVSYIVTCRWAMEGYGSIANLNELTMRLQENELLADLIDHEAESFYTHSTWHLLFSWEIQIGFVLIFGVLCYIALANVEKS